PEVIVIHDALLTADQGVAGQPAADDTVTLPVPPPDPNEALVGETSKPHWVMVKTCPRTEMVPVREAPLLACTVKLTVPLPMPGAPPVIGIRPSAGAAPQRPPAPVVTLNDPLPPPTPTN